MAAKNKNQATQTKGTLLVPKEALYPYLRSGDSILKDHNLGQNVLNTSENIVGIDSLAIKKIEDILKLTFLFEKDATSKVCMANNPEVRDEFKDIFDLKDLLSYSWAVLHSPSYLEKYKELSNIDFFEVPYPNDTSRFWKLVDFGVQLRNMNLLKSSLSEEYTDEADKILKEIAALKIE